MFFGSFYEENRYVAVEGRHLKRIPNIFLFFCKHLNPSPSSQMCTGRSVVVKT